MAEAPQLDVLAVAAHPDDVEITSGGLLIKLAKRGRKTGVIDLTQGEMGTYGDESDRAREAAEAARIMGLAYRENLAIPDAAVAVTQENKLKIARVIRETRPEMVILPHWEQRHPDHLACSRLGYDACYLAGLKKLDLEGEPYRPRKIIYASYYRNQEHSFLVDISDEFNQKVEAVAAYQSQFGESNKLKEIVKKGLNLYDVIKSKGKNIFMPGINIYDLLYTRGRYFGQRAGVLFAEGYTIKEPVLIDDPQKLPVNSI
ncbi:bacillithiol biosynthesis deacetylase BshB1 [candidate division GN15 bacterium]|nr:bacillithiol biosynthesis deacetylase BshB1 [candidate division GN15 bacterium]